jgi:CYTH domain-containing protein
MLEIENEKRYLIAEMPDLAGLMPVEIEQYYLVEGSSVRIRAYGKRGFELTKKFDIDPSIPGLKSEHNIELDEAEFSVLKRSAHRGLMKARYEIPIHDGYVAEIDVYRGPLAPLAKVEVEFSSQAERDAFVPPSWFGRDVTGEKWASNSRLAGKTYEDIADLVKNGPPSEQ